MGGDNSLNGNRPKLVRFDVERASAHLDLAASVCAAEVLTFPVIRLKVEDAGHVLQRVGEKVILQGGIVESKDIAIGELRLTALATDVDLKIHKASRLDQSHRVRQ